MADEGKKPIEPPQASETSITPVRDRVAALMTPEMVDIMKIAYAKRMGYEPTPPAPPPLANKATKKPRTPQCRVCFVLKSCCSMGMKAKKEQAKQVIDKLCNNHGIADPLEERKAEMAKRIIESL